MENKVIAFENKPEKYIRLAEKHLDKGDYVGALGFLFSALKSDGNEISVLTDIADIYADMGLFDLSNKYWFTYMSKIPKSKRSFAYEDLAINFFYLDKLWATNYYLNKKVEEDGFLSRERFEEEAPELFEESLNNRLGYNLAYPFDRADYSERAKVAKKALSSGDVKIASKIYESIPKECRTEEIDGEFAITKFLEEDDEKAIEIAKDSLKRHGENVTAYCNLSSAYRVNGNREKAEYYYKKALDIQTGKKEEAYQIATCAIEMQDHENSNRCLKEILKERENDLTMRFLYGLSFINMGDYKSGREEIETVYKTEPTNRIVLYYLKYAEQLEKDGKDTENLLPFEYKKDLPDKIAKEYKSQIKALVSGEQKPKKTKNIDYATMLDWGVKNGDDKTAKNCIYVMSVSRKKEYAEMLKNYLIDPEVSSEAKGCIIYSFILSEVKEDFCVVNKNVFLEVKNRKLIFDKTPEGLLFLTSYALALAKGIIFDMENYDRICFIANKLFKDNLETVKELGLSIEELSILMIYGCKSKRFERLGTLCKVFNVEKEKIKKTIAKIYGEGEEDGSKGN